VAACNRSGAKFVDERKGDRKQSFWRRRLDINFMAKATDEIEVLVWALTMIFYSVARQRKGEVAIV